MKIFIVNQYFPEDYIGGSEIQCWLLAKHLPSLGHETTYVAASNPKKRSGQIELDGVKVRYLSEKDRVTLREFWKFYKMLRRGKPDVCYIRIFRFAFCLAWACRLAGAPAVFNTSTLRDCQPYLKGSIKLTLNPISFLRSFKLAVQRYLNFSGLKKMRVVTINKEHAEILKKYGIEAAPIYNSMEYNYEKFRGEKKNVAVWVNNVKKRKNPESYLKLAQDFRASDWRFLMIGYLQNDILHYEKLIKEMKVINPNFEYLGGLAPEEVDKVLAESKIFVNTCEVEGFGNNFIQAWLAECPTITLSFDPDDIIKNNELGFHSGTQEQMKKDLKRLMVDEDLRIKMGERAREWALKNHNINLNKLKYEKVFKEAANKTKNQIPNIKNNDQETRS